MNHIVFFLEEASAEALIETLLPRFLPPNVSYRCIVFEGKQDLEKQLTRRIRGYRTPNSKYFVLRDQDSGDCVTIKEQLRMKCCEAKVPNAIVRIACHEIESWYLADLAAVEKGLKIKNIQHQQFKEKFRNPDNIICPSKTLKWLAPGFQKISGARSIGPHLDLQNSRSRSFFHFLSAVQRLINEFEDES